MLPPPPNLTTLVSISCGMAAEKFFALCREAGVTTVVDMRIGRSGQYALWTHSRDIGYFCGLHQLRYVPVEDLMPTREMRNTLHAILDDKVNEKNTAKCGEAWTQYLEGMVKLVGDRHYLNRGKETRELIYGTDKVIAFMCLCHHHSDCHRSAVLGNITTIIEGVKVRELYPDNTPPPRDKKKLIVRDIPTANIIRDDMGLFAPAPRGVR